MSTESVISERGQVTLPKELRDRLGLRPGTAVTFIPSPEGLLIRKSGEGKQALRELFGIVKDKKSTDRFLEEIRGPVE